MGSMCHSQNADNDDSQSPLVAEKQKRTIQILFLGANAAGKTTVIKQLKKIHNKINDDDIRIMAPYIQHMIPAYMKTLCFQCGQLSQQKNINNEKLFQSYYYHRNKKLTIGYLRDMEHENYRLLFPSELQSLVLKYYHDNKNEELRVELSQISSPYNFEENQLASKIITLWADERIKETLKLRSYYQTHDNVDHFLNRTQEILQKDYEPTFEDYMRIRTRSTGFAMENIETHFDDLGQFIFQFTDVGGSRGERKKWMKILQSGNCGISCIIYVIGISQYDLKLYEDNRTNRLVEAINLFHQIADNKFLHDKRILIFLNKYDMFKEKIKNIPITVALSDFPIDGNPYDEMEVVQFVTNKLLKCLEDKNIQLDSPLQVYKTNALDTNNIKQTFEDVMLDLVKEYSDKLGNI